MDRALTLLGTLAAVGAIGFGVVHADVRPAPPAGLADAFAALERPGLAAPFTPSVPVASDFLSFAALAAYEYAPGLTNLPDSIRALDGKTVAMRGFMLPPGETEDVRTFDLVANHISCCFGVPAGMNGQVHVSLRGSRGLPYTDEPVEVRGTFHAKERREEGYVLSIFEVVEATGRITGD